MNGHCSSVHPVLSGVPQGSVLGPLLFLTLISDIDKDVAAAFVSSFADDTRVTLGTKNVIDSNSLQKDIDSVYKWADTNNMSFNCDKFEVLRYGYNQELKSSSH